MKSLALIGIMLGLISCPRDPPPSIEAHPETPCMGPCEQEPNKPSGEQEPNKPSGENGADATWHFSSDQITIGEQFWVRVDVHGKIGEQLDFELEGCDRGFFLATGENSDENEIVYITSLGGERVIHGMVGNITTFIILNYLGQKSASSAKCSLRVTVISRRDGTEGESFTKELQLQNGKVALDNIDAQKFRQGTVSTTVSVAARPTDERVKEFFSLMVCTLGEEGRCELVGHIPFDPAILFNPAGDGVVESPFKPAPTEAGRAFDADGELPAGEYLLIAVYGQKGADTGETLSMAARAVKLYSVSGQSEPIPNGD